MEQVRVRMPQEMIEQVKQVASEMALMLDTGNMSFSDALRHLVKRGLQDYYSNGHEEAEDTRRERWPARKEKG